MSVVVTTRAAVEDVSVIAPPGSRTVTAACRARKWALTLTAITRSQSAQVVGVRPSPAAIPVLSVIASSPPSTLAASVRIRPASPGSLASPATAWPVPPSAVMRSTVAWAASWSISATATAAPSRAARRLMARPIPVGGSVWP